VKIALAVDLELELDLGRRLAEGGVEEAWDRANNLPVRSSQW